MTDIEKLEAALNHYEDESDVIHNLNTYQNTVIKAARAHLNLLKAIEDKRLAVVPVENISSQLCGFIEKELKQYRCVNTQDEDGSGYPLIDALSPRYTIADGLEEVYFIADSLYYGIKAAISAVDQKQIIEELEG